MNTILPFSGSGSCLLSPGITILVHYTLAVGEVARQEAPDRLTKGLARHPVPIMLLARLAVALSAQGQGVGKALLRDAMHRTLQAAEIAGIRAFAAHAKDESARRFYEKFDFIPSPADQMHLFVLLKDVRRIMAAEPPPEAATAKSRKSHQ